MKISYIITTIRPPEMAKKTIDSIRSLAPHNHEIIISSPNPEWNFFSEDYKVNHVQDLGGGGSVQANNSCINIAKGDWLAFLPDDFKLQNLDINAFQTFLDGPEMQKKTFKMFSFHARSVHKENAIYDTPIDEPYEVMHFPIVARETIENKLDGVIFNHRFKHHYVDHFLGWYASKREKYEPLNYSLFMWPNPPQLIDLHSPGGNQTNHSFTSNDRQVLDRLYQEMFINPNMGYND